MARPHVPPGAAETALRPLYRAILNDALPVRVQRALLDAASIAQPVPRGAHRVRTGLGGRPADRFTRAAGGPQGDVGPRTAAPGRPCGAAAPGAVLYLHGGGFAVGSLRTHRALTARLARDSDAAVFSLDYRLAPEHPYPAALDDAEAAYMELVDDRGYAPDEVAIAGDSAGGGIAAGVTRRILDAGRPAPAALALIAPAVEPSAPTADTSERDGSGRDDAVLRAGWVRQVCEAYRGDTPPDDPGFAPLHADPSGFPPTLVQIGSHERMLSDQVSAYAARLRAAGVDVTYVVSDGLWHVAQLQSGLVREAARSCDRISGFLRAHLP